MLRVVKHENPEWGEEILVHKNKEYSFPYHIPSHEVFNNDPKMLIRAKCAGLVIATPVITVVRSAYSLALAIFKVLAETYHYLDSGSFSSSAIYEPAFESIRALGYGVLLTRWAVQGMMTPYNARRHYSQLERELNRHADGPHRDKFYLAFCFQRRALMPQESDLDYDQKMQEIAQRLMGDIDFISEMRTSLFTGAWCRLMNTFRSKKAYAA
jgi:hypothetical protein